MLVVCRQFQESDNTEHDDKEVNHEAERLVSLVSIVERTTKDAAEREEEGT